METRSLSIFRESLREGQSTLFFLLLKKKKKAKEGQRQTDPENSLYSALNWPLPRLKSALTSSPKAP